MVHQLRQIVQVSTVTTARCADYSERLTTTAVWILHGSGAACDGAVGVGVCSAAGSTRASGQVGPAAVDASEKLHRGTRAQRHHVLPVQPAHEPASAQSTRGLADGLHTAVPYAGFSIEADPACKAGCAQAGGRYLPSVHPLHRAANLTDQTPVVPQSDADVHEPDETSSPGRGVMVGFCSRPPLSPARRRRACLAGLTHGSRGASCYKPLRHHQSAHSRPHIYAHHTRALRAPDWLAGRPRVCTGWQSPPTSLRSKNKPTRPSLTGAFAKVGSPHPQLHQDWAHSCRICAGTRDRAAPSPTGAFADM